MAMRVFISRDLSTTSTFLQRIRAAGAQVHGESLLTFKLLPFTTLPDTDWIFFYSKTAVRFFFQQLSTEVPSSVRFAAIGERTAAYLHEYVERIDFIGNGQPLATADHFLAYADEQRVLFPRALNSRKSVQRILDKRIKVIDLVIYDNQMRTNLQLADYDILVFTSPLNVAAYFSAKTYQSHQFAVAIGDTTAAALRRAGLTHIYVAKLASEEGLAEVVLALLKKSN